MIIDNNPIIDKDNHTFEVQETINQDEEVSISVNGLIAIILDDITDITDKIITVKSDLDIDYDNDSFSIIYES
jgi:hypothetical protein